MIQGLAGVRDETGWDGEGHAVGLDLQEDRAGDVPSGVAAGLEGGADAAGGEGTGIGLALDQTLAGELGHGLAVAGGAEERVVLLGTAAGHGHEPVGVVGGAVGEGPLLHALRHRVGDGGVERLQPLNGAAQLLEDRLGQVLALGGLSEDVLAVDVSAGALEVVLGGGHLVAGNRLDGLLTSGHLHSCRPMLMVWPLPRFPMVGR